MEQYNGDQYTDDVEAQDYYQDDIIDQEFTEQLPLQDIVTKPTSNFDPLGQISSMKISDKETVIDPFSYAQTLPQQIFSSSNNDDEEAGDDKRSQIAAPQLGK